MENTENRKKNRFNREVWQRQVYKQLLLEPLHSTCGASRSIWTTIIKGKRHFTTLVQQSSWLMFWGHRDLMDLFGICPLSPFVSRVVSVEAQMCWMTLDRTLLTRWWILIFDRSFILCCFCCWCATLFFGLVHRSHSLLLFSMKVTQLEDAGFKRSLPLFRQNHLRNQPLFYCLRSSFGQNTAH